MRPPGAALLAGLALDELLGDPARLHPVAGFGRAARALERAVYRPTRAAGAAYAAVAVAVPTLAAAAVQRRLGRPGTLTAIALTATLGGRTLRRTATRMADLLDAGDLAGARALAPALVSRRPEELDAPGLARAALESLAENTADAVAGPLLWAAVAGAPGAVAYRAVNTLDAMVGYRTGPYADFGWAAARLDDLVNWPVARLTAAATVAAAPLAGAGRGAPRPGAGAAGALRAWRRDGHRHPSPNAGRAEAAFAGALGVRLGGPTAYADGVEPRAHLGDGPAPATADVRRAARLSACAAWLLAAALAVAAVVAAR
jgi:adenosylcobinamide-phosphate synthase